MASIRVNANFLIVTCKHKSVVYNFGTDSINHLEFNPAQHATEYSNEKSNCVKNSHAYESVFMPCCDISTCGQWFVSNVDKHLLLWKTADWSLNGNSILQRSPTKFVFSPNGNNIIVADKSGDIHIYLRNNLTKRGSFLLGHLSLIFDVIITNDEKYIMTCDRDEKIRVSCYTNSYNIQSYCLGHEEFVTCLKMLPHSNDILISASGDCTLRLWSFKDGRQLLMHPCLSDFDKNDLALNHFDGQEQIAIIKFETFLINSNECGICVLFDQYKGCLVYNISGSVQNLKCKKLQNVSCEVVVHDLCMSNGVLWLSSNNKKCKVHAMQWDNGKQNFEFNINIGKLNNALTCVNSCLSNIDINIRSSFLVLYKKMFDNVQDYYKRKNDILCAASKKNKINE